MVHHSLLGIGVALALVGNACTGGDESTPTVTATAAAAPTGSASATTTPTRTVSPTSIASPTSTATPLVGAPISGLFREPRFEEPDASVTLGPRPASVFPEHDGLSVVLYDIERGTVRDLGFGMMGVFSPDNRYMAWTAFADDRSEPPTLRVIELESGVVSDFGEIGGTGRFEDERHVNVRPAGGGRLELVNVESGERKPSSAIDVKQPELQSDHFLGERRDINGSGEFDYRIFVRETTDLVLTVAALDARIVPDDQLLLLVDAGLGVGNIFLVDLESLEATFVATTLTEPFAHSTIPLVASADHVVWTPNACDFEYYQTLDGRDARNLERRPGSEPEVGNTTIYDRAAGTVIELSDTRIVIVAFTPDGRMIDGIFGGLSLLDPVTLSWDVVLPGGGSTDVSWSADYRYASRGEQPGHGGYCPS